MPWQAQFNQGDVHSSVVTGEGPDDAQTVMQIYARYQRGFLGHAVSLDDGPVRYKLWLANEHGVPLTLPVEGTLEVVDRRDPDVQASTPAHTEQKSQPDRIYEWLSHSKPATVREIAKALSIPYHSAKKVILLMQRAGRVQVAAKKKKSTRGRGRAPRLWTAVRTSEVTRG